MDARKAKKVQLRVEPMEDRALLSTFGFGPRPAAAESVRLSLAAATTAAGASAVYRVYARADLAEWAKSGSGTVEIKLVASNTFPGGDPTASALAAGREVLVYESKDRQFADAY